MVINVSQSPNCIEVLFHDYSRTRKVSLPTYSVKDRRASDENGVNSDGKVKTIVRGATHGSGKAASNTVGKRDKTL